MERLSNEIIKEEQCKLDSHLYSLYGCQFATYAAGEWAAWQCACWNIKFISRTWPGNWMLFFYPCIFPALNVISFLSWLLQFSALLMMYCILPVALPVPDCYHHPFSTASHLQRRSALRFCFPVLIHIWCNTYIYCVGLKNNVKCSVILPREHCKEG